MARLTFDSEHWLRALPSRMGPGIFLLLLLAQAPAVPFSIGAGGLIVVKVRQGSTEARAGLEPGDILRQWRRPGGLSLPMQGPLSSTFDWAEVLLEQVPRGRVEIHGTRHGLDRSWVLPGGAPAPLGETEIRPVLSGEELRLAQKAQHLAAHENADGAAALWLAAERSLRASGKVSLARWFALEAAHVLTQAERGDKADALYQRLVTDLSKSLTGAPAAAQLLREWAEDFRDRHEWGRAEAADRRALAFERASSPDKLAAAWSLTGLGYTTAESAGTLDPEVFFRQAMAIRERLAPDSADIATGWWDLGKVAAGKGDFARARGFYQKAVSEMERAAPESLYLAEKLASLGKAEYFSGDIEAAARTWERGLKIAQQQAPEDLWTAGLLQGFGDLELRRKNWQRAARLLERALALSNRLAVPPFAQMDLLTDLAHAERQLGLKTLSADHSCRAMVVFDGKRERAAGSPETQLRWGKAFADYYRDCAQARVEIGESTVAFETLERGRARAFLNLVAEGPLRPADLKGSQAAQWRDLDAEYDRTQAALADLRSRRATDAQSLARNEGRLREIERRKREILTEKDPAQRRYPPPLDLGGVRRALDAGTLLLSYVTTEEQILLFAVAGGHQERSGVSVFTIPLGAPALTEKVEAFRQAVVEDRFHHGEIERRGSELYDLLLRPAEPLIAKSRRLLIVPDGPLHILPFAALVRNRRFLAEQEPIHFATSATAYAEIRKRRRARPEPAALEVLALGDPAVTGPRLASATPDNGFFARRDLAPLPASRREIEELARLFPRARIFLGREATEERAKQEAGRAAILHFAVHARLDERMPANSALVMSPPRNNTSGNGLLQAWEITEKLHLDADLVTLSACDTALGPDMGGEGLIGLTRAFQAAGARSVLATLWEISDAPSAVLMQRFYTALRAGKSKDEALREAQVAQLRRRSRAGNEPFYWAAYQLYGDWR